MTILVKKLFHFLRKALKDTANIKWGIKSCTVRQLNLSKLEKTFLEKPLLATFLEQEIDFERCDLLISMTYGYDLFEIYHDQTTNTHVLLIYDSCNFYFMYFITYLFEDCIKILNAILDADYDLSRNYRANRWWTCFPSWYFLDPIFITEETKQEVKNILQELTGSINFEDLTEDEVEQITAWENVLGKLKFN